MGEQEITRSANRGTTFAIGALVAVTVVAVVIAVLALTKGSQNLTKIHTLERQVHALAAASGGATASVGSRVKALETSVSALESKATAAAAKLAKAEATLHTVTNCMPELESQIGGLTIAGETYAASYIKDGTNISRDCTSALYGTG